MTSVIGVMLPRDLPIEEFNTFAVAAEAQGFGEVWVVEDLGFRGGIAQAAAVLAATNRIRVGIGILPAAVRNVHFTAMELATLEQLFPGRVVAGIGHGMPDWMKAAGCWPRRPVAFLAQYARDLRRLLAGDRVGEVALERACLPDQRPPVLLGVRGPRSLAASGQCADGTILAEPCTPEYVRWALDQVAADGDHRLVTYNVAAVDDDSERAIAQARAGLGYVGDEAWRPHLVGLDFAEDLVALRERCEGPAEFAARLPAEWVQRLALAGTPEQVRARVSALTDAGATSVVLTPTGGDPVAELASLAAVLL